jgi:MoaA/NifB/PqqE/SkfB family radical SAM enzyme
MATRSARGCRTRRFAIGFSGGEPLVRPDVSEIVAAAGACGLYTNLISSGVGLTEKRARELRDAGLESMQLSFQADEASVGDSIAGARAHEQKLKAGRNRPQRRICPQPQFRYPSGQHRSHRRNDRPGGETGR